MISLSLSLRLSLPCDKSRISVVDCATLRELTEDWGGTLVWGLAMRVVELDILPSHDETHTSVEDIRLLVLRAVLSSLVTMLNAYFTFFAFFSIDSFLTFFLNSNFE